jgi:hypothetical protein
VFLRHAASDNDKVRTCVDFEHRPKSWQQECSFIARIEVSFQETKSGHLTQATDIRYCVTSLKGDPGHLFEKVYCARGQAENLIKLHKAQLASDRTSCHSATANQVRLVLHSAAYWIMHALRSRLPSTSPLARCEFATLGLRLIQIGARVIEHAARIRVHLPTSCPQRSVFAAVAASCRPRHPERRGELPLRARSPSTPTRCTESSEPTTARPTDHPTSAPKPSKAGATHA